MANDVKVLSFKVDSFRKIPNPYLKSDNPSERNPQMYMMVCDVMDIPDDIPMDTNPRKQSLKTEVAKEISNSLISPSDQRNFYLLNRGLLLSAETVSFDSEKSTVAISFSDLSKHGNVDGGHTYEIIKRNIAKNKIVDRGYQYVKIEVLTGIDDMFEQLAKARNFSVKVQEKSMAELGKKYEIVKDALQAENYFKDIGYVENENKRIDIMDIMTLINMFNIDKYPNTRMDSWPIISYSSKAACLKAYLDEYDKYESQGNPTANPFYKMKGLMPDIIRLYDHLERYMPKYYKGDSTDIKRYGSITGVYLVKEGKPKFKSRFFNRDMDYLTPNGFLYPIVAAFRSLIDEDETSQMYKWKMDPVVVLDKMGNLLVTNTVQQSRELGNNPNATGKSASLWQNLYMLVNMMWDK